jgi:hypothetical protein
MEKLSKTSINYKNVLLLLISELGRTIEGTYFAIVYYFFIL